MDELVKLIEIFINTVESLEQKGNKINKRLYVLSNDDRYMNFKPQDFKKKLTELTGGSNPKKFLEGFRALELIIANQERFTNTQKINNKTLRVISVDKLKYDFLIGLRDKK